MSSNPFQHVDVRVTDMEEALQFYSKLLPEVGFTENKNHVPNTNRIAFQAGTRKEVDRVAAIALEAGALNMNGPRACPEYSTSYYAAFFEDPCRNCLEICYLEG